MIGRPATAFILKDNTASYLKPVMYPKSIIAKLKKIYGEEETNYSSITEVIFHIIEEHERNNIPAVKNDRVSRENKVRRSVRFREKHYDYIISYIKKNGKEDFSDGIISILEDYFDWLGE